MSRPVICQGCRERFVRQEGNNVKDSSGYYHAACYEKKKQAQMAREDLLQYCFSAIGSDINPALIQKQIKDFTTKFRYTESGIKGTLYYLIEVKKQRLNPKMGIALVPYHYEKARLYFSKVDAVSDLPSFEEVVQKPREITISKPESPKRGSRVVNLEDMFEEGEI